MKIVDNTPALLTNPEALAVLKDRLARKSDSQPTPSEAEVIKSLEELCKTKKISREQLQAFTSECNQNFTLNKFEILQLINHCPTSILEAYLCLQPAIDNERLKEDDLDKVVDVVKAHFGQSA